MDTMAAIRETFFQECEEGLAELEQGLLLMEGGETDSETVNAVFRAVHSVKGGAGAFGLDELVRFAHVFETTLDHVRADRLAPKAPLVALLLRAADVLSDLVSTARGGEVADPGRAQMVAAELAAAGPAGAVEQDGTEDIDFGFAPVAFDAEPPPAATGWRIALRPHAALYAKANDPVLLLRELARIGELTVELDDEALPDLAELDPEQSYLAWRMDLNSVVDEAAVRETFDFVEDDCDLEITPITVAAQAFLPAPAETAEGDLDIMALLARAQAEVSTSTAAGGAPEPFSPEPAPPAAQRETTAHAPAVQSIRVELDRVDRLIDLIGELVIHQAMLNQRVSEAGLTRASATVVALDQLEGLTREIQDSVMAIRAQPVKSVVQRMPRLVREIAALTGKQVRLVTEGESTEVDKTVIERLTDPLTHMIRNAIDHGLETPEARLAAGKPPEGVVRLTAQHRSGRIVIEVADDGAGIDRQRVKAMAAQKKLIASDASLSDEEIDNLIFMPGFSTATAVSDISGRGVGMDVVRRSIQALGGRISIASQPGKGSTFTLSLPLTLAVLDGMVVGVGDQTLVVPLTAVVETLQPRSEAVHRIGDARVMAVRDLFVPLIDVGVALGWRDRPLAPGHGVALLVESEAGGQAALLVDAIQGQRQVVIKSLEANYRRVPGVAAATILGDGRVALIMDVDAVVGRAGRSDPLGAVRADLPSAAAG